MSWNKKSWLVGATLLLIGAVAGGTGGWFLFGWRLQPVSDEQFLQWQHIATQNAAKAYLQFLQATESPDTNQLRRLQNRGRVTLTGYVEEVNQLQRRYQYRWCPMDAELFQEAQTYLARHPRLQSNEPKPRPQD